MKTNFPSASIAPSSTSPSRGRRFCSSATIRARRASPSPGCRGRTRDQSTASRVSSTSRENGAVSRVSNPAGTTMSSWKGWPKRKTLMRLLLAESGETRR